MKNNLPSICEQIRRTLKAKNIKQEDFAKMMKISTPTMKRWLRGEGLLFKDLIRLLEALNLNLSEVALIAEGERENQFTYSLNQEQSLSNEAGLLAFFDLLLKNKTPVQIMRSYGLTHKSVSFYLSRLDKIQLIEWLPKNKVKLLVSGEPKWIANGPLSQKFRQQIVSSHLNHFLNDREHLKIGIYSLGKESVSKLNPLLVELTEKVRNLEIKDSQAKDIKKLTTLIVSHGQNEVPILNYIPNK